MVFWPFVQNEGTWVVSPLRTLPNQRKKNIIPDENDTVVYGGDEGRKGGNNWVTEVLKKGNMEKKPCIRPLTLHVFSLYVLVSFSYIMYTKKVSGSTKDVLLSLIAMEKMSFTTWNQICFD